MVENEVGLRFAKWLKRRNTHSTGQMLHWCLVWFILVRKQEKAAFILTWEVIDRINRDRVSFRIEVNAGMILSEAIRKLSHLVSEADFVQAYEYLAKSPDIHDHAFDLRTSCLRGMLAWSELEALTAGGAEQSPGAACAYVECLYQTKQYDKAISYLEKSEFLKDLKPYVVLLEFDRGRYREAAESLANLSAGSRPFQYLENEMYLLAASRESIASYVNEYPKRTKFGVLSDVECLMRVGCISEAKQMLARYVIPSSPWFDSLLALANAEGFFSSELYDNVFQKRYDHESSIYTIGVKALQSKQFEMAQSVAKHGLHLFPDSFGLLRLLQNAVYSLGYVQEGEAILSRLMMRRPYIFDIEVARRGLGRRDRRSFEPVERKLKEYERFMSAFNSARGNMKV